MKLPLLLTKAFFALSIYGAQAQIPVCSTPSSDKPGNVQVYADPILKQYLKPTEVLVIEVPAVCCEPALWNAQIEASSEEESIPSSRSGDEGE